MACCENTLDLGCINHCNQLSFGEATISGTYNGIFTSGNIQVTQQITVTSGNPFIFDMTLLNEQMSYTLVIYNSDNEQITLTINSVEYNCFSFKTVLDGVVVPFVPVEGCTPMCKEIYDPNNESTPVVFNIIAGTNVTVDNTDPSNPIVSSSGGGGGIESIVAGTNITVDNTDPLNPIVSASGGGAVDSVNGETGVVVLNTSDISDSSNKRYVTDAQLTVIGNTSGTNTGDNATNTQYSGLDSAKANKVSITEVTTSRNVLSTDYGNIILVGANITLTVPTGLPDNFICNFDVLPTFTLTLVFSGTTVTGNAGLTIASDDMATLYKRGATETYRLKGETA